MSDVATLLKQMREQREFRVELEAAADGKPAKIVWLLRPLDANDLDHVIAALLGASAGARVVDTVVRFTTRWDGFTEADLLPGAGGSDKVDYHPDVWREVVGDSLAWTGRCRDALVDQVNARAEKRKADSGNS
jgi:hypothetical protein